jgi:hypothetical protein
MFTKMTRRRGSDVHTGYTAKVDAINAAQFESDELIQLAWQLGREARELGIEEQPPLRSWEDVGAGIL